MTNTPSPDEDRELIEVKDALFKLRSLRVMCEACSQPLYVTILDETLPVLESLLADRAKLEERVNFIEDALHKRMHTYRTKRDKADPLAEDDYNRHDAFTLVLEAFEIFETEAGFRAAVLNRSTDRG